MIKAAFILILVMALGFGGVLLVYQINTPPVPDMLAINSAMMEAMQTDDETEARQLMRDALLHEARLMEASALRRERILLTSLILFMCLMIVAVVVLGIYINRTILQPFKNLKMFASRVAQGDLSFQLEMDRENRFGAFSESFDLMRQQLETARENERLANISKKELVASLSHDIKTPVASIKVISELFQAKHGETAEMESISKKADQIDLLISNMFTATLEDLKQLKVTLADATTPQLEEEITASDYQKKIQPFTLPECVVTADLLRFRQVMDNIIGNSYKYAETDIEVSGVIDGECFTLTIRDCGPAVSTEEMALLCEKFYRASNAEGKSGSGLGLFLSKYFIEEMGGTLTVSSNNGFCVAIRLKI